MVESGSGSCLELMFPVSVSALGSGWPLASSAGGASLWSFGYEEDMLAVNVTAGTVLTGFVCLLIVFKLIGDDDSGDRLYFLKGRCGRDRLATFGYGAVGPDVATL